MEIGQVSTELLKFFRPQVSLSMLLYGEVLLAFWRFCFRSLPRLSHASHGRSATWTGWGNPLSTCGVLEVAGVPMVGEPRGSK